jgi:putative transposase
LINPRKPWRTIDEVEYATAQWVHWFNHDRLYEYCGDIPPGELERAYYAQQQRPAAG